MSMRIAILVSIFPQPSETFVIDQAAGLIEQGHDVRILALHQGDADVRHPAFVRHRLAERYEVLPGFGEPLWKLAITLPMRGPRALARLDAAVDDRAAVLAGLSPPQRWRLAVAADALRRADPPDVVHAHFGPNGLLACRLRRLGAFGRTSPPVSTVFHGYDATRVIDREGPNHYRFLFEEGDLLLPVSEFFRARLIDLGAPPDRTTVHRMGIDLNRFRFEPRSLPADGPVRLISVARLVEKKGLAHAIAAVVKLRQSGCDVEYDIIGDGPIRPALEQAVRRESAAEFVHLLGPKPHDVVRESLGRSHLMLAPSVTASDGDQEGVPVAIMEAMAAGLPVVSTIHSGIPELIEDGVSGRLVPESDADALAEAIRELLAHPERLADITRAARSRVEAEFSLARLNVELSGRLGALAG